MADIAAASGVSRQLVYHHFESRAGLLVAMTRHHDARERLSHAPRRDARAGARRGLRGGAAPVAAATCPRSCTWPARWRRALIAGDEGGAAWRDRMDDIHEAFRLAVARVDGGGPAGAGLDRRHRGRLGLRAQPRLHVAAPRRRSRMAGGRLRRAHDRLDHGRGRRPGAGRITIGPRSIPASALSPRRRGCPLDPGPIAFPWRLGQGLPGGSGRAFGRSSQEETVGWLGPLPEVLMATSSKVRGRLRRLPPTRGRKPVRPAGRSACRPATSRHGG